MQKFFGVLRIVLCQVNEMIPELQDFRLSLSERTSTTVWHSHSLCQIGCVVRGQVIVWLDQEEYRFLPNDFYLITADHMHQVRTPAGNVEYHGFLNLTASPEYFSKTADLAAALDWLKGRSLIIRQEEQVASALAEIERYWKRGNSSGRLAAQCLLVRLFTEVESFAPLLLDRDRAESMPFGNHRLLQQAVSAVERLHHAKDIGVPDIARACKVSRSTLDKLFNQCVSYGPKEFLQRYRIDRAREMLRLEQFTLSEIAARSGFPDVFAFSRVFKRIVGIPPGSFVNKSS